MQSRQRRPHLDDELQSARLTRASPSPCFRTSIIQSALCFALVHSAFWDYNCGMQLAGFVPPMDDELSDEAGVGVSRDGGSTQRKPKEDLAQRLNKLPRSLFLSSHKKFTKFAAKVSSRVCAEFWPQPTSLALM